MIQPRGVTIGTCGICGGPVTVPTDWQFVTPPRATCQTCGAIAAQHGPVLPMFPASPPTVTTTGTGDTEWIVAEFERAVNRATKGLKKGKA